MCIRDRVVIAFSFIAVNALLIGVPIGITSAVYDPSFGSHMVCATMVFVTITSAIIPYTYLRITKTLPDWVTAVSYTHLRAHETPEHLVCRLLLEKKKNTTDHN
eukprot:TRINITY_DN59526_c0_g1_i1.p1 TRINITY_DN59526_c0_g1~~TRINITY_DN59526_c0_g1_i1.p1  ORF type:complete len:104 (-),score=30.73 TRINITY_DN59526_c0_g1_i1:90-401(-)